jgi:hypothetical protein
MQSFFKTTNLSVILILLCFTNSKGQNCPPSNCYPGSCYTRFLNISTGIYPPSNSTLAKNDLEHYWTVFGVNAPANGCLVGTGQTFNTCTQQKCSAIQLNNSVNAIGDLTTSGACFADPKPYFFIRKF